MDSMASLADEAIKAGFKPQMEVLEDIVVPPGISKNAKSVKTRRFRDDDVILCTYPKSGTHWVWEILYMLAMGKPVYAKHWKNCSQMEGVTTEDMEALPSPRILYTHLPPSFLSEDIGKWKCHVINVQRNPKDAIVSFYHQQTNQNWIAFEGSWADYLETHMKGSGAFIISTQCATLSLEKKDLLIFMFDVKATLNDDFCRCHLCDGGMKDASFGSIMDHCAAWDNFPEQHPDVPFIQVHYEDLKKDDVKEIRRLANFLNRPLPDKVYEEIAEACRFDKLKYASEHTKDQTYRNRWREGSTGCFRKGVVGDWKTMFTVAQSERFNQLYKQKLSQDFSY